MESISHVFNGTNNIGCVNASTDNAITDLVLKTIRQKMPITTLFKPELKIDLALFVKDQILFSKLAMSLAILQEKTMEAIENLLIGNELLKEFKKEQLKIIYEACFDVLNKEIPKELENAIEGRIYTLKNAILAQKSPKLIQNSQVKKQSLTSIQKEGANFIRSSLKSHLEPLNPLPFQKQLTQTATQLIPFVKKITRDYLLGDMKVCPENPLTFRNRTGYNHHGQVAAILMEVCLSILGYETKILNRLDLDPHVTCATSHNVIEVKDPDQNCYVVDPSYLQFYQDVYLTEYPLPTEAVLVLSEVEVDAYVEEKIMTVWNKIYQRLTQKSVIEKVKNADLLCYYLPKESLPSDRESWVRKAFKGIWDLKTYKPILCDRTFQEIFLGDEDLKIYESIKHMGIANLTKRLSFVTITKQLSQLPATKNSPEALSLIAQLPVGVRSNYSSFFDIDPRLSPGISVVFNAYFRSLKNVVNPDSKDLSVIYGCCGSDCTTVFLSTDAREVTFVDLTEATFLEFKEALNKIKTNKESQIQNLKYYLQLKQNIASGLSNVSIDGKQSMPDLPLKLFYDLKSMGVNLDLIKLTSLKEGIQIEFPWKYEGAETIRQRTVTYITVDLTNPKAYPTFLKEKLKAGFDIFYMKAATLAPHSYPEFISEIFRALNPGGWLMTTDKSYSMELINPEPYLKEPFSCVKNTEMTLMEGLMTEYHALRDIDSLNLIPDRSRRSINKDLSYWTILNLRKKEV